MDAAVEWFLRCRASLAVSAEAAPAEAGEEAMGKEKTERGRQLAAVAVVPGAGAASKQSLSAR